MRSTAFWDIFMDFSLVQPHARHRFLRDITALKSRWPYYLIMILDPILRFNWVFYAIFTHDTQHSSIASFLIGFAEVTRRGMWTLLRVENEHCSNVAQYKASRDVPLPYHLDTGIPALTSARVSSDSNAGKQQQDDDFGPPLRTATWTGAIENQPPSGATSTGVDVPGPASGSRPGLSSAATTDVVEEGRTPGEDSLRMRRRADTAGKRSIVRIIAEAHKQDFEKKRKPGSSSNGVSRAVGASQLDGVADVDDEDDDDDDDDLGGVDDGTDDDETGSMVDERMEVREAEAMLGKGRDGEER
ncbi:EXS family-domain-containing protein [Diaporthe sp. PMI_573]|nr:EXS family-domain-containing protein [Diaporthaceae sp. PMI_573]